MMVGVWRRPRSVHSALEQRARRAAPQAHVRHRLELLQQIWRRGHDSLRLWVEAKARDLRACETRA